MLSVVQFWEGNWKLRVAHPQKNLSLHRKIVGMYVRPKLKSAKCDVCSQQRCDCNFTVYITTDLSNSLGGHYVRKGAKSSNIWTMLPEFNFFFFWQTTWRHSQMKKHLPIFSLSYTLNTVDANVGMCILRDCWFFSSWSHTNTGAYILLLCKEADGEQSKKCENA